MTTNFLVFCASALLVQAIAGHIIPQPHPVFGGSAAASSAASAAASRNAAAASAAAASAAAARGGRPGSAAASSAASAAAARNAAAASAAAASAAGARGGAASSAAASAAATAAAGRGAYVGSAGAGLVNLADYNIIYSEPLLVTSTSPLYPSGLYVSSQLDLQGPLRVSGVLPFLSAVQFEDSLATDGSGVATCGCGSDLIGITSEI